MSGYIKSQSIREVSASKLTYNESWKEQNYFFQR
jgi:hypothetical protein